MARGAHLAAMIATRRLGLPDTTSDRVLGVLELFTAEQPHWTVEMAAGQLRLPVSTAYRYFRSLTKAGILIAQKTGSYGLGPAIIQMDRQIRLADPLILAAQPRMRQLCDELPKHTFLLLCRLFHEQVMCIHQEPLERPDYSVGYERGRLMPLFRGAASKIILAYLPHREVRSLFEEHSQSFTQAGLGRTWAEIKGALVTLRNSGVSVTRGEVDPAMCGVSVPLLDAPDQVAGSLSVVIPARYLTRAFLQQATSRLKAIAAEVAWSLSVGAPHSTQKPLSAIQDVSPVRARSGSPTARSRTPKSRSKSSRSRQRDKA